MLTVLAIDPSSHIGWAVLTDDKLIEYGKIDVPCKDNSWPLGIHAWAKEIAKTILDLIKSKTVNKILIERPNSSRFRNSQNVLDWTTFELISLLLDAGYMESLYYIDSSHWRKVIGLKLNSEQKKQNKMAKEASKEGKILKINGKRKGRVTKKHLSVNFVNEKFGLQLKLNQNDSADAICVASSFFIENQ